MIFWPSDKPVAQICFSEILRLDGEWVPTVWAMLPQQELRRFQEVAEEGKSCQSSLIFPEDLLSSSQPTIPWITTLNDLSESQEPNPRYLRCLLNWKTPFGQTMGRLLGQRGQYQVLLFALENSQASAHTMAVSLSPDQRLQLLSLLPPL
ncbi:hypothetical protein [Pantanalinema sp. GBBB05]|uniref:hypothetical protein n=1 Tax=Pantanalinema sp. GBBB05 TaxID=2604139 RepID=UPI001DD8061B|nr:hypothetical protein [Pantanalinema sp. GBBB05]